MSDQITNQPNHDQNQPNHDQKNLVERTEYTAMLAISIVILQAFITVSTPDPYIVLALICFALAIPALAGSLYRQIRDPEPSRQTTIVGTTGSAFAFFGIGFTFAHISSRIASLFAISCFIVLVTLFLIKGPASKGK